jgi:hypothetical protein
MSNCIKDCRVCRNLVFSTAVTLVTIDGADTLVIDIPSGFYPNCRRVCLVVTQTIPATTPITAPVAISIGGDTTTVYPIVNCDCTPVTACAIQTRTKYGLCINTTPTSAVFKSLRKLNCYPANNLAVIPVPTTTATAEVVQPAVFATRATTAKTTTKTTKEVQA